MMTCKQLWQYIKQLDTRCFATRKILLWQQAGSCQYNIQPWIQRLGAIIVIGLIIGIGAFIASDIEARNSANVTRQQLYKTKLLIADWRDQLNNLATTEQAPPDSLSSSLAAADSLLDTLEFISIDPLFDPEETRGIVKNRQTLIDTITRLQRQLEQSKTSRTQVQQQLLSLTKDHKKLENLFTETTLSKESLQQQYQALDDLMQTKSNTLNAIQQDNQRQHQKLMSYIGQNHQSKSSATSTDDMNYVVEQVGKQINQHQAQAKQFKTLIETAIQSMARITTTNPDLTNNDTASTKAAYNTLEQLIEQVETVQLRQSNALASLNQWIEGVLTNNQTIMTMTGIELEQLVDKTTMAKGVGGPYKPVEEKNPTTRINNLHFNLEKIENSLKRLQQYKTAFECLPLRTPVDHYRLTSHFGMRKDPFNNKQAMHNGIDMAARIGTQIYAPAAGTVARVFNNGGYGNFLEIKHSCGVITRYGHLQKVLVEVGQTITFNQPVATIGNSGRSTGAHLHYEILLNQQPQNPIHFINAGRYVFKNTSIH